MKIRIGRYRFELGKRKGDKKLCPLSLMDMDSKDYVSSLPNGKLLLKKPDYALFRITRKEPLVERMLKITSNKKDDSRSFIIMYIDSTFVGYKSKNGVFFIPSFSKKDYIKILEDYSVKKTPKKRKREYKKI
jgi:hypothetical protein